MNQKPNDTQPSAIIETGCAYPKNDAVSRSIAGRIWDVLFGFDYFIAHRWADGHLYATSLAEELRKREFDCFLDETNYEAGGNLRTMQQLALRRTTRLIVVVSPQAHFSPPVGSDWLLSEVQEFRRTKGSLRPARIIVPVGTSETLSRECYPFSRLLPELPVPSENGICILDEASAHNGVPSSKTISKLIVDFTELRRKRFRLRALAIIAFVMTLLAAVAVWNAVDARRESLRRQALLMEASRREYVNGVALLGGQRPPQAANSFLHALHYDRTNAGAATLMKSLILIMNTFPAPLSAMTLPGKIQTSAASRDGNRLIAALEDGTIAGYAADKGQWTNCFRYSQTYTPYSILFSDDGRFFAYEGAGRLEVRETSSGALLALITRRSAAGRGLETLSSTTFDLEGKRIAVAWQDGSVEFWHKDGEGWRQFKQVATGLTSPLIKWGAKGIFVAGANGTNGTLRLLDPATLAPSGLACFLPGQPTHLVPGGQMGGALVIDSEGAALVCEPGKSVRNVSLDLAPGVTTQVELSPDGRYWAIAHVTTCYLIPTKDGAVETSRKVNAEGIISNLAFSPDGRHLFIATQEGIGVSYSMDANYRDHFFSVAESSMLSLFWSEELHRLVTVSRHGAVGLWNFGREAAAPLVLTPAKATEGAVLALQFDPDGALLAMRGHGSLEKWLPPDWHRAEVGRLGRELSSAQFLSRGKHLLVTTSQRDPEILETSSMRRLSGKFALADEVAAMDASVELDRVVIATRDRALNAYRLDGSFLWGRSGALNRVSIQKLNLIPEKRGVLITGNNFGTEPGSTEMLDLDTGRTVVGPLVGGGKHESHGWLSESQEIMTVEKGTQSADWARIWSAKNGTERVKFPIPASSGRARFWPFPGLLQTFHQNPYGMEFYSLQNRYPVGVANVYYLLHEMDMSSDGRFLAAGNKAGELELCEVHVGFRESTLPSDKILTAAVEAFSGVRTDENGAFQIVSLVDRVESLHKTVVALADDRTSDFARLLTWKFQPGPNARISPFLQVTRRATANRLIALGTKEAAAEAYEIDPTNPLVHIALAGSAEPDLANFYRNISLRRLPEDAATCLQAAELLVEQNDFAATSNALMRAEHAALPGNPDFLARLQALRNRLSK